MSEGGRALAHEVKRQMGEMPYRELFGFKPTGGSSPVLLILGESIIVSPRVAFEGPLNV